MANAKKCDRCGVLYEKYDLIPDDFSAYKLEGYYKKPLDLCPSCHVDLTLWIQNRAEFTLKEVTDDVTDGI